MKDEILGKVRKSVHYKSSSPKKLNKWFCYSSQGYSSAVRLCKCLFKHIFLIKKIIIIEHYHSSNLFISLLTEKGSFLCTQIILSSDFGAKM